MADSHTETLDEARERIVKQHATQMEKLRAEVAGNARTAAVAITACAVVAFLGVLVPLSVGLWRWALS